MPFALLLAAALAAPPEPVVLGRLDGPVLALAPAGPDRVLVLEHDGVSLWRLLPEVAREAILRLQPPVERVRHPGGLIHAPDGEGGGWIHRSGAAEALLVRVDEGALSVVSTAAALPWTGAPAGVRFRTGTSLIEGRIDELPEGPYLSLSPDGRAAVSAEGRLLLAGEAPLELDLAVGSALVRPWPGVVVASSASPDAPDALLIVRLAGTPRLAATVPIDGRIQALTMRREGPVAVILAAVSGDAGTVLVRLDVRRADAGAP